LSFKHVFGPGNQPIGDGQSRKSQSEEAARRNFFWDAVFKSKNGGLMRFRSVSIRLTQITLLASIMSLATAALAEDNSRHDRRQTRQEERINQGQSQGSLTAEEAEHLKKKQAQIQAAETRAESDGQVTGQEKLRLEKMQDRQNRRIHRMKHNSKNQ